MYERIISSKHKLKYTEMSEIKFDMKEVEKKREGSFQKKSIFDPILDKFIEGGHELVEISVPGRSQSSVAHSLKRRIEKRQLDIIASTGGGFLYLEKKPPEPA